jgi:hypothetical protein
VLLHGISATPLTGLYARRIASATLAEERASTASDLLRTDPKEAREVTRIEPRELARRLASENPPIVLDVRSRSSYEKDPEGIPGDVRVPPDEVENWAAKRARDQSIVAYCT